MCTCAKLSLLLGIILWCALHSHSSLKRTKVPEMMVTMTLLATRRMISKMQPVAVTEAVEGLCGSSGGGPI